MVADKAKLPPVPDNGGAERFSRESQAERDLKDSKALLGAVLNTEVDAIVVMDEQGTVQSVNPAFERIFGYAPEEAVGKNVRMLMPSPYPTFRGSAD